MSTPLSFSCVAKTEQKATITRDATAHQIPPSAEAGRPEAPCYHPHHDKHGTACNPGAITLHRGFGGGLAG